MTAYRYVTIWCDEGYDRQTGHRPCPARFDEPIDGSLTGARRNAAKLGWRRVRNPVRDLCPEHAHVVGVPR